MRSATFLRAVSFVIDRIEGGGTLITDSGGLTRWGISKRAHPTVDVENLTRDGAVTIYYGNYWHNHNLDTLPSPLALLVFDAGVNMHPPVAIRFLQDILRVRGDGILGPETAEAAIGYVPAFELRARFNEIRLRYYEDLAKNKPFHLRSLYGWRMRCFRVADEAGRWDGIDSTKIEFLPVGGVVADGSQQG